MCVNTCRFDGIDCLIRPIRKMKIYPRKIRALTQLGKRISDLLKLMEPLEEKARRHRDWKEKPTYLEAVRLYDDAGLEDLLPRGSTKRKRHDQISWRTLVKNAHVENKRNR